MKSILVFLLTLIVAPAFAKGGGSLPTPCTATPPSQASTASITNLVMCDTFSDNRHYDLYNTELPGYDWYPRSIYSSYPATAPNLIGNDGTGLLMTAITGPGNTGKGMQTAGFYPVNPNYTGTLITGSFYAEIDAKWQPITPSGITDAWPAFWLQSGDRYINGTLGQPVSEAVEFDILEYLPGTPGGAGSVFSGFHDWQAASSIGGSGYTCSSGTPSVPGSPTFSNYNTYGFLFIKSTENSGTGILKSYVNNLLMQSCTFTASGAPSCTSGLSGSCSAGNLMAMDTQRSVIMLATSDSTAWPVTWRNFHLWQKP